MLVRWIRLPTWALSIARPAMQTLSKELPAMHTHTHTHRQTQIHTHRQTDRQTQIHTHTLSLVVYNTVQYKQWVHTWSICQSYLQILQHKLQRRPGPDTNTRNTHNTDRIHSATGARGSLQPGFNQVIPLHQRAPWCDVSLTSLTSWSGKPLHQGSSHSVNAAHTHVENRKTRTKQEKRLEKTPQGQQSCPRCLSVCQRVRNVCGHNAVTSLHQT